MFDEIEVSKDDAAIEMIETLNRINFQIAELATIKEVIEQKLIKHVGRAEFIQDEETGKLLLIDITRTGTHQHCIGKYKVKIKTDYNYGIDKEEYQILKGHFRNEFDPVSIETSYKVNKKILDAIDKYGSEEDRRLKDKVIIMKPAKPHVSIGANV